MNTLFAFFQLVRPFWGNKHRWRDWLLLIAVIGCALLIIQVSVLMNEWNKIFYDALTAYDTAQFIPLLLQYLGYIALVVLLIACGNWLRKLLLFRWRSHLTRQLEAQWLSQHNLYRLTRGAAPDNPDQRIAEDSYLLADKSIELVKSFFYNLSKLVAFTAILWQISGEQRVQIGGSEIVIHGYLVWIALIYTLICSLATHFIGRRLKPLNVERQQTEASYRATLIRARDNAEQIAFYHGEPQEQARFERYFRPIADNWQALMGREFKLECFSATYLRVTMLLPIFAVLPLYLAKLITFGTMMQARSAFSSVQDGFGWFMDFYKRIMEWAATVQRLAEFQQALQALPENSVPNRQGQALVCENLVVNHPRSQHPLFAPVSLNLQAGQWLHLQGDSGTGKTSLLRALAGLVPKAQGLWHLPQGRVLFSPQKSYLPKDRLANLLQYPQASLIQAGENRQKLAKILTLVGLPQLIEELDSEQEWGQILSGGEQQRIAVARILLFQPDLLCMDEITNQLDSRSAHYLLALLRAQLPQMMVIGITHQQELVPLFDRQYVLRPVPK